MGTRQQLVHEFLIRIRRFVGDKRLNLFRLRRQPEQIEIDPANQAPPIDFSIRRNVLLLQFREHKAIDVIAAPRSIFHGWRRQSLQRLKRPELPPLLDIDHAFGAGRRRCGSVARIGRAHFHPLFKRRDFFRGERSVRRHLLIFELVLHGLNQAAVRRIAGHNHRPAGSAASDAIAAIEIQFPLQLFGFDRVTRITIVRQNRANRALKKRQRFGRRFSATHCTRCKCGDTKNKRQFPYHEDSFN